MGDQSFERIALLARLVSSSVTRAPQEYRAPIHGFEELLSIIKKRFDDNLTVEYYGVTDLKDEAERLKNGSGHDCVRIREINIFEREKWGYATFLIEYVDNSIKKFPVVNTRTFDGREIEAAEDERGAKTAHVVVRYPIDGSYDDGSYRCAIELSLSSFLADNCDVTVMQKSGFSSLRR
jgi:hypothetical protein